MFVLIWSQNQGDKNLFSDPSSEERTLSICWRCFVFLPAVFSPKGQSSLRSVVHGGLFHAAARFGSLVSLTEVDMTAALSILVLVQFPAAFVDIAEALTATQRASRHFLDALDRKLLERFTRCGASGKVTDLSR